MSRFLSALLAGALIGLLLIEGLLRCLPVNSGARMASTDESHPYARYLPHQDYVYSHGWQLANAHRGQTNGLGFTHSLESPQPGGVLVVGDSYIESLMLDDGETLQGRLAEWQPGRVAAISAGANGLADAIRIVEHFAPRLHPATIVLFIEPYDLREIAAPAPAGHNAFALDGERIDIVHAPYVESPYKQQLSQSALFRYAYYNLKLSDWLNRLRAPGNTAPPAVDREAVQIRLLQDAFARLQALAQQHGHRTLLLVDADRQALYQPNTPHAAGSWLPGDRERLLTEASRQGLDIIDMAPVFAADWAQHHARFDWLPADGHWNARAHRLAAAAIRDRLSKADSRP
ncbi:MAG: hypothetical protein L6Q40_09340 [Azonexus sp.]|nr:hypothetical protein [Azonexus sp.]